MQSLFQSEFFSYSPELKKLDAAIWKAVVIQSLIEYFLFALSARATGRYVGAEKRADRWTQWIPFNNSTNRKAGVFAWAWKIPVMADGSKLNIHYLLSVHEINIGILRTNNQWRLSDQKLGMYIRKTVYKFPLNAGRNEGLYGFTGSAENVSKWVSDLNIYFLVIERITYFPKNCYGLSSTEKLLAVKKKIKNLFFSYNRSICFWS